MISAEHENSTPSTSSEEINTYDLPISPFGRVRSKTGRDRNNGMVILKGICKFIALTTVIVTLIFSATELIDLVASDMDAEGAILKRIFGSSAAGADNFFELILNQSFGEIKKPSATESLTLPSPPESYFPTQSETTHSTPPSNIQTPPLPVTDPPVPDSPTTPIIPENCHPIITMDMSLLSYGEHFIYNSTALSPDIKALADQPLKKITQTDGPLVLVIHTHGTEAFMENGATYYSDEGELARSDNTNENMISVGTEFVRVLKGNGIDTIHCQIMHDSESYRESYARSAETIKYYLKEYPSIRYVFDLHRDSLMRSTEELISAVTYIDGERYAQIMPVVGSGYNGYESNLSFALQLRELLNDKHTSLARPVCLRESQYNQSLTPVSLLLEIGTSGNTLAEAKKSAALTAQAIAVLIKSQTN